MIKKMYVSLWFSLNRYVNAQNTEASWMKEKMHEAKDLILTKLYKSKYKVPTNSEEKRPSPSIQTLSVRFTRYLWAPVELLGRLSHTENPEK